MMNAMAVLMTRTGTRMKNKRRKRRNKSKRTMRSISLIRHNTRKSHNIKHDNKKTTTYDHDSNDNNTTNELMKRKILAPCFLGAQCSYAHDTACSLHGLLLVFSEMSSKTEAVPHLFLTSLRPSFGAQITEADSLLCHCGFSIGSMPRLAQIELICVVTVLRWSNTLMMSRHFALPFSR